MPDKLSTPNPAPMAGWPVERLLDALPLLAGVRGGKRMKGASDAELDAWAHGISGAAENVREIIADWRKANTNDSLFAATGLILRWLEAADNGLHEVPCDPECDTCKAILAARKLKELTHE